MLETNEVKARTGKQSPVNSEKVHMKNELFGNYFNSFECILQVREIVKEMGCSYFECSAKENTGIKEIFMSSLSAILKIKKDNRGEQQIRSRSICCLV